ncbi:conserved Plasmodium protein, unknown function [Plasmodium berghei]|uniref:Uncharacterized protein n=2 Tax=Plasmodium berghei TaxID=5821 RepID=A0A509AN38_PLABA|nr:conserved Plasmodium protein, unknown function [Plasmodium berghei ANKA]CXI75774.1 conserved Plasmodium protein, unknown function [Plasmodium berghei]SCM24851.1 conserved Plasmodium protein, unknown function [Plasmodium berghei]SCN27188.1 conserved Plasmodium protein, unknown function [Plasmodium berghei]SCO61743.1 conserved Plasmodium protein, unknown function [Plasmodium berghei]SCO63611.1 conserved Plasmodium protein, unknown function [Plasmodium berghei]|eukprot:XP_034422822.1 conserved Plasmodium protein, unknown function [Plasmodium berghei ANKA]
MHIFSNISKSNQMNARQYKGTINSRNKQVANNSIKFDLNKKKTSPSNASFIQNNLKVNMQKQSNNMRNSIGNNINQLELKWNKYLDNVLKLNEYVKLPNSVNNEHDKKKWKKAHTLRNKMKEYDLMTRKKLFNNNIINNKAKLNRERYIVLNRIPRYREAFPSVLDTSNKIKEDIIRTYLKSHACYLVSEMKKNNDNNNMSFSNIIQMNNNTTGINPSNITAKSMKNMQKKNNSTNGKGNNSLNYLYNKTINYSNGEKNKKNDLSYNLWEKAMMKNLKKENMMKKENGNKSLKKIDQKKNKKQIYNYRNNANNNYNENDLKNYNIQINGVYSNLNNNNKKKNMPNITPKNIHIETDLYNIGKNQNLFDYGQNVIVHDEKREDAYEIYPNTQMNYISKEQNNSLQNFNMHYSTADYSKDDLPIRENFKTDHMRDVSNTQYQYSNKGNSNEYISEYSNNRMGKNYENYNKKKTSCGYKKDRFSLFGRIKHNKDIEVKLLLNKA